MADTGWQSPGTMAVDTTIGSDNWTDPDNAKVSDDSNTIASGFDGSHSYYLKATNFGFSIPSGATINGILISIERFTNQSSGLTDYEIKIVKANGSIGTTNKSAGATWSTTETYYEYGGSSDLWGETWGESDIEDVDFGVVLSTTFSVFEVASVDHIRIKVYYTVASATNMKINIGDTFKEVPAMKINIGDTWKDVTAVKQNIGDVWKDVF